MGISYPPDQVGTEGNDLPCPGSTPVKDDGFCQGFALSIITKPILSVRERLVIAIESPSIENHTGRAAVYQVPDSQLLHGVENVPRPIDICREIFAPGPPDAGFGRCMDHRLTT
jgi:hypothetical protein